MKTYLDQYKALRKLETQARKVLVELAKVTNEAKEIGETPDTWTAWLSAEDIEIEFDRFIKRIIKARDYCREAAREQKLRRK